MPARSEPYACNEPGNEVPGVDPGSLLGGSYVLARPLDRTRPPGGPQPMSAGFAWVRERLVNRAPRNCGRGQSGYWPRCSTERNQGTASNLEVSSMRQSACVGIAVLVCCTLLRQGT